jgi:putative transposase
VGAVKPVVANGKTTPAACREGGITEQTNYRWRKEYGGLQVDQAQMAPLPICTR